MRRILLTGRYAHEKKRVEKRGKNLEKLDRIVRQLAMGEPLAKKHKPHILVGNWRGHWECHIESDWLLVYQQTDDEIILIRTGKHDEILR